MELPLFVGANGSDSSLEAVDWALEESARHGPSARLVHGSLWERYERRLPSFSTDGPSGATMAETIAASRAERSGLRNPELMVSGEVLLEHTASVSLHTGHGSFAPLDASAGADMIVVGALRRHGHVGLRLGRVAPALLHHAECPVVVVPQRA
jgi:nucleotide-binding universal stress UspA family protein